MLELIVALLAAAALGLSLYCLIDSARVAGTRVRGLPLWAWRLVILLPIIGAVSWLAFGRPQAGHRLDGASPAASRRRPARWTSPTRAGHAAAGSIPTSWRAWPIDYPESVELLPRVVGPEDDPAFIAELARQVEQLRRERGD